MSEGPWIDMEVVRDKALREEFVSGDCMYRDMFFPSLNDFESLLRTIFAYVLLDSHVLAAVVHETILGWDAKSRKCLHHERQRFLH